MFYVGQRVICVDDKPDPGRQWGYKIPPIIGAIYTIMGYSEEPTYHNGKVVVLVENGAEHTYRANRFRPLTDQKKSVSFTQGAPLDSERWDNRRKVVEPFPVDGWS